MPKQIPERTCLGGGGTHPKAALWRFVAGPEGKVWFDLNHKAPGRGAYIYPESTYIKAALKRNAFTRKLNAKADETLLEQVLTTLKQQLIQRLGLAKKAGQLVSGTNMVLEQGQQTQRITLLAQDAGQDIQNKLASWETTSVLTKSELEQAVGQPNCPVVSVANQGDIGSLITQIEQFEREEK